MTIVENVLHDMAWYAPMWQGGFVRMWLGGCKELVKQLYNKHVLKLRETFQRNLSRVNVSKCERPLNPISSVLQSLLCYCICSEKYDMIIFKKTSYPINVLWCRYASVKNIQKASVLGMTCNQENTDLYHQPLYV